MATEHQRLFTLEELFQQKNGRFQVKTDHVDEFTTIRGLASRSTADDEPAWLLEQTIVVNGVIVSLEYADNAQFTQTWDDRLLVFPSVGSGAGIGDTNFFMSPIRLFDEEGKPFTTANPVPVSGSVISSGLSLDLRVTKVTVTDVATALPTTALTSRNTLILHNQSLTQSVFIGKATVTTSGANEGWELDADAFFTVSVTDSIPLFGICTTGNSALVKILELA